MAQTFNVTGSNLTDNISIVAPTGFEVSTNGITFSGVTSLTQSGGNASGTISVRIAGNVAAGAVSGNVSLATTGLATATTVAVSGTVTVPALTLSLNPTAVNEDAGSTASTGTVGIPVALSSNLTISLVSSNTAAATVPTSVVITNGQTNATFAIAAVANSTNFSTQTAGITASASGYSSASANLTVNNVDASYLELTALGAAKVENFNGMASSSTADLPFGFKVGTDWSTATNSQATLAYGTAGTGVVTASSSGGIINWANGTNASSTDRALGFLNTGSYTSPKTIVVAVKNSSGSAINTLDLAWNYEKFRSGSRDWAWTFRHGDTSAPTNTATAGNLAYAADSGNTTVFDPPQSTNATVKLSNLNIANGAVYYLSWTLTGSGGSSNGQGLGIDDLSVTPTFLVTPSLGLSAPTSINEGVQGQQGTVSIPTALANDLSVTVTSSLPSALTVDGGGGASGSTTVTIVAGSTSNTFYIDTIADNQVTPDRSATLTATADGYLAAAAGVTVKNLDLPRANFGTNGFTSDFSAFTNASTLPLGWSISGSSVAAYSEWPTSTSGTKYNTNTPFLFGYKHTGSSGTVLQTLTLSNSTAETITALTVTYRGRANTNSGDGRDPAYSVTVAGQSSTGLAYSTSEGDNAIKAASVTGLNLAPGAIFAVVWSSEGNNAPGSNTRKTIGLSDVSVVSGLTLTTPALGPVSVDPFTLTQTSASVVASVTSDGGAGSISERGFVYALASVSNVVIGGSNVGVVTNTLAQVGAYTNTISGLSANTGYTVRSYAINSQGTNYSSALGFTTLQANPTFTGVYTQNFAGVSNSSSIPAGWRALSSSNLNTFAGTWSASANNGGFYTRTGSSGILGYLHTGSTGVLTNKLTLVNGTGSKITNLYVSYTGEVSATNNPRSPAFAVAVNGADVPELAYSTDGNTNASLATQLTSLNIETNDLIVITWTCDRGANATGNSKLIGLTDVRVSTSAPGPTAPSNLSYSPSTINGFVGQAISSLTPTVTGTVDTYSVNPGLPAGLSINPTSGVISGTPLATASSTYTVTAANAGGSTTTGVTIQVSKGTPIINVPPTAPALTAGQALSASTLAGGSASVPGTFAWTDGTIVPNATGSYGVTFTPTDAANYNTATTTVSVTVNPAGSTFAGWSGGASLNSANVGKYAIGGASSPTATDGVAPTSTISGSNLVLTAIVRTDDTKLTVVGETVTTLADYTNAPSITPVNGTTNGVSQTGVPNGHQRQAFSVPQASDARKFLRLKATLAP